MTANRPCSAQLQLAQIASLLVSASGDVGDAQGRRKNFTLGFYLTGDATHCDQRIARTERGICSESDMCPIAIYEYESENVEFRMSVCV